MKRPKPYLKSWWFWGPFLLIFGLCAFVVVALSSFSLSNNVSLNIYNKETAEQFINKYKDYLSFINKNFAESPEFSYEDCKGSYCRKLVNLGFKDVRLDRLQPSSRSVVYTVFREEIMANSKTIYLRYIPEDEKNTTYYSGGYNSKFETEMECKGTNSIDKIMESIQADEKCFVKVNDNWYLEFYRKDY
jgi:hypothetical protein